MARRRFLKLECKGILLLLELISLKRRKLLTRALPGQSVAAICHVRRGEEWQHPQCIGWAAGRAARPSHRALDTINPEHLISLLQVSMSCGFECLGCLHLPRLGGRLHERGSWVLLKKGIGLLKYPAKQGMTQAKCCMKIYFLTFNFSMRTLSYK